MSIRRVGSSPVSRTISLKVYRYARVVELVDSLDSGSSVHYAREGSSPSSRTKIPPEKSGGSPRGLITYEYARVVELADSLDSGSSVLYGRAGSSPASGTKIPKLLASGFFALC